MSFKEELVLILFNTFYFHEFALTTSNKFNLIKTSSFKFPIIIIVFTTIIIIVIIIIIIIIIVIFFCGKKGRIFYRS